MPLQRRILCVGSLQWDCEKEVCVSVVHTDNWLMSLVEGEFCFVSG